MSKDYIYYHKKRKKYIVYIFNTDGKRKVFAYSCDRYGDILAKKLADLSLHDKRKYYDYFEFRDNEVDFYVYTKLYGICKVVIDREDFELVSESKISIYKSRYTYYATTARGAIHRMVLNIDSNDIKVVVDHIDKNGLNDTKRNLRAVPVSINNKNSKIRSDNTTGVRGVVRENNIKYSAIYTDLNGKTHKRSFSIRKYGEEIAFNMAVKTRLEAEEKYGYLKIDESSETNPDKNIGYLII